MLRPSLNDISRLLTNIFKTADPTNRSLSFFCWALGTWKSTYLCRSYKGLFFFILTFDKINQEIGFIKIQRKFISTTWRQLYIHNFEYSIGNLLKNRRPCFWTIWLSQHHAWVKLIKSSSLYYISRDPYSNFKNLSDPRTRWRASNVISQYQKPTGICYPTRLPSCLKSVPWSNKKYT